MSKCNCSNKCTNCNGCNKCGVSKGCDKCSVEPTKCHPCYPTKIGNCHTNECCEGETTASPINPCFNPEYCNTGCEFTVSPDCVIWPDGTTLTNVIINIQEDITIINQSITDILNQIMDINTNITNLTNLITEISEECCDMVDPCVISAVVANTVSPICETDSITINTITPSDAEYTYFLLIENGTVTAYSMTGFPPQDPGTYNIVPLMWTGVYNIAQVIGLTIIEVNDTLNDVCSLLTDPMVVTVNDCSNSTLSIVQDNMNDCDTQNLIQVTGTYTGVTPTNVVEISSTSYLVSSFSTTPTTYSFFLSNMGADITSNFEYQLTDGTTLSNNQTLTVVPCCDIEITGLVRNPCDNTSCEYNLTPTVSYQNTPNLTFVLLHNGMVVDTQTVSTDGSGNETFTNLLTGDCGSGNYEVQVMGNGVNCPTDMVNGTIPANTNCLSFMWEPTTTVNGFQVCDSMTMNINSSSPWSIVFTTIFGNLTFNYNSGTILPVRFKYDDGTNEYYIEVTTISPTGNIEFKLYATNNSNTWFTDITESGVPVSWDPC